MNTTTIKDLISKVEWEIEKFDLSLDSVKEFKALVNRLYWLKKLYEEKGNYEVDINLLFSPIAWWQKNI